VDVLFEGFVLGFVVKLGQVFEVDTSGMHEVFKFKAGGEGGIVGGDFFGELGDISFDKIEGIIENFHIMPVGIDSNTACHELVDVIKHVFWAETATDKSFLNMQGEILDELVDVNEAFAGGAVDLREVVESGLFEDVIFDAGVSFEVFEVEDEFLSELEFRSVVWDQAFD
jgi:hypothetical protein